MNLLKIYLKYEYKKLSTNTIQSGLIKEKGYIMDPRQFE
jgi:hypothetical protein